MFLNIITPCTRPFNLESISKSINIPRDSYRWIVVFDSLSVPENIPDNCEAYAVKVNGSVFGNGQRNFALDLIENGHVYFNDDDTTLHEDLWENIKDFENCDIISFSQNSKDGSLRLNGKEIVLNKIDSHNIVFKKSIIENSRWTLGLYNADGVFAEECANKTQNKCHIPKVLSIYNTLRD